MRKNKFRIYDTNNKEYLDNEDYQIDCNTGEIYESIGVHIDAPIDAGIVLAYGLIAEEFTGVLDKNGVEICENDTLAPFNAIVVWNNKLGAWCAHHQNDANKWLLFTDLDNLKVVGTIHDKE